MINEIKVGLQANSGGATTTARAEKTGATVVTDAHGRFYETVAQGNVYFVNTRRANASIGFPAGAINLIPFVAVYNPPNSGKNLAILGVTLGIETTGTVAANLAFGFSGGPTANVIGTATVPINMLSLAQTGSVAKGFSNASMTGLTTLSAIGAIVSLGVQPSTAAVVTVPAFYDVGGLIVCTPGNAIAFGSSAATTLGAFDASLIWEEIAI